MNTIYIVTEIKTVPDQTAVLITSTQHSNRTSAEHAYYLKVSAAANPANQFPMHSVILATNAGFVIDTKSYMHDIPIPTPEPKPEPEPEPTTEPTGDDIEPTEGE